MPAALPPDRQRASARHVVRRPVSGTSTSYGRAISCGAPVIPYDVAVSVEYNDVVFRTDAASRADIASHTRVDIETDPGDLKIEVWPTAATIGVQQGILLLTTKLCCIGDPARHEIYRAHRIEPSVTD